MEDAKKNGGYSAFTYDGMSKREVFAAVAMQGLVAAPGAYTVNARAALAVECADALLRALAEGGEGC